MYMNFFPFIAEAVYLLHKSGHILVRISAMVMLRTFHEDSHQLVGEFMILLLRLTLMCEGM